MIYLNFGKEFDDIEHICSEGKVSLGDRQKMYERILDLRYDQTYPIIIRLDGKTFSHRVKQWKLEKPFDERFNKCMIKACEALFKEIQEIDWIWTGSDEISIVLKNDLFEGIFSRRISKILSITASVATYAFNIEAMKQGMNIEEFPAVFDSRITILPNKDEIFKNILFRQNDCIRNSISQYARHFYSTKELASKQRDDQLKMLNEKGFDWDKDAVDWSKYGVKLFRVYDLYDLESKTVKSTSLTPVESFDEKTEYTRTRIEKESKRLI